MIKRFLLQFLIIFILGYCYNTIVAQQHATFHQIGLPEEFSSYQTRCLFQDKRGLIWIGTDAGLDRWDGRNLKNHKYAPFDSLCFPAKGVYSIAEDDYNNLWLAVGRGLVKFDLEKEVFEKIKHHKLPKELGALTYVKYDSSGFLWLGYFQGLFKYFPGKDSIIQVHYQDKKSNYFRVESIEVDTMGITWVANRSGLYYFNKSDNVFRPIIFSNHKDIPLRRLFVKDMSVDSDGNIWMLDNRSELLRFNPYTRKLNFIYPKEFGPPTNTWEVWDGRVQVDQNGKVWFGNYNGLIHHDPATGITTHLESKIKASTISDIIVDTHGNIIVSTYSGVKVLKRMNTQIRMVSFLGDYCRKIGLITEILRDDNYIWIGTSKAGLIQRNIQTGTNKYFKAGTQPGDLPSNYIYKILKDPTGRIWVMAGKELCLFHHDSRTFESFKTIPSLFITADTEGFFWICEKDGMLRFDPITKDTMMYNFDRSLPWLSAIFNKAPFVRDLKSIFWVGGANALYRIDLEHGSWTQFVYEPNNPSSIPDNIILSIYCDSKERLWAGTYEGLSLITYDKTGSRLVCKNYFSGDNVLGRRITDIAEDADGNIWASNYLGAYVIKPNGDIESYSFKDGLPEQYRVIWTMNDDPDGSIYIGNDQVYQIPKGFVKENNFFPTVLFTGFSIFGEEVRPGNDAPIEKSLMFADQIDLRFDQNFIRLDFASLNYNEPYRNRFRFFLDGVDRDTIDKKEYNYAEYSNLSPGKYRFWVTGSNNSGLWNPDGISILIRVHPPWFKSMAAIICYILFLVSGIFAYIRFRTARLQKEKVFLEEQIHLRTIEIHEKNRKITELDEVKNRFYDNISHELRTPLTLIAGPVNDLLQSKGKLNNQENNLLGIVKRNTRRLHQLIDQLLEISKLETGRMKLEISEGDLSGFLNIIAASFQSIAEKNRIRYEVDVENSTESIFFDRDKLEKVVCNLISNALKYTAKGGSVRLSLKYLPQPSIRPLTQVKISVSDTGPGIPKEERNNIFDRFYQVDGYMGKHIEGIGLGLALTKEIVDLYRGEIQVESEIGIGTTFYVLLPVSRDSFSEDEIKDFEPTSDLDQYKEKYIPLTDDNESPLENEILKGFEKSNQLILIVEDNDDLRAYIAGQFKGKYQVIEAENGAEGMDKSIEYIPDMVITDLIMPVMGGIEFCRKLREHPATNHIPVIMLTARADKESRLQGIEATADDYIIKPFDSELFLARVKNLINQRMELRKRLQQELVLATEEKLFASPQYRMLREIVKVIDEHLEDPDFDLASMASQLNMSTSGLNRKIKAITGATPHELVRIMRLKRAASLFRSGESNVTQVMYQVGLRNPSHFASSFRKYFGINPSKFITQTRYKNTAI